MRPDRQHLHNPCSRSWRGARILLLGRPEQRRFRRDADVLDNVCHKPPRYRHHIPERDRPEQRASGSGSPALRDEPGRRDDSQGLAPGVAPADSVHDLGAGDDGVRLRTSGLLCTPWSSRRAIGLLLGFVRICTKDFGTILYSFKIRLAFVGYSPPWTLGQCYLY